MNVDGYFNESKKLMSINPYIYLYLHAIFQKINIYFTLFIHILESINRLDGLEMESVDVRCETTVDAFVDKSRWFYCEGTSKCTVWYVLLLYLKSFLTDILSVPKVSTGVYANELLPASFLITIMITIIFLQRESKDRSSNHIS